MFLYRGFFTRPYKSTLPVICVGGVVAGGSGKTPVAHALVKLILQSGLYKKPVILTRGYGGVLKGPSFVDNSIHTAKDVGDEALLHASRILTIVSRDRAAGARLAELSEADVIIMDDGLQNLSLQKNASLLVIDAVQLVGNGHCLPAGPLREPLSSALKKSALVIEVNGDSGLTYKGIPTVSASYQIISSHDKNISYYAFAGLGRPEKFLKTLQENEFILSGFKSFADHHPYSLRDMDNLLQRAGTACLITTEKDFVRIPRSYHDRVDVLTIQAVFSDEDSVIRLLP